MNPLLEGYRPRPAMAADLAPRPYLHPLRTLAGHVVTDEHPADHPWHVGLSVAVPLVDGRNFWGGPTYRRGCGYADLADHGVVEHRGFSRTDADGFAEQLRWRTRTGEVLLAEERTLRVAHVNTAEGAWTLSITTALRNVTGREVALRTPASEGRSGAGYGGIFWRGAPEFRSAALLGPGADRGQVVLGEEAVHGSRAGWVAVAGPRSTLVFTGAGEWFVRGAEYPGVCLTVAPRRALPLAPGHGVTLAVRIVVADGTWDSGRIADHVARDDRPR